MTDTETSNRTRNAKLIGLALTTALAGVTLSGCSTSAAPTAAHSASKAEAALTKGKHRSAVEYAEAAVLAEPHNVSYRATLGAAYLDSGRFASAASAFGDAIALGDTSSRTLLSLSLAYAADGQRKEAWTLLDGSGDTIAPSDLGLAYALAGQPERGIYVLSTALRSGENTAKVRQNLAYSFAIAGRWREARLMAAEDVPAGELGARMTEWATLAHPAAYRERIASLLSVPVRLDDPGQPVQLVLSNFPTADQLAAEAIVTRPQTPPAAAPAPVKFAAAAPPVAQPVSPQQASRELPPIPDPVDPIVAAVAFEAPAPASRASQELSPVYQPVDPEVAAVAFETTKPASKSHFVAAFNQSAPAPLAIASARPAEPAAARPAPVTMDTSRFAEQSSAKPAPAKLASAPKSATPRHSQPAARQPSTHLVQLGSFLNEAGARRAWEIYVKRYPELKGHDMVITRAVVDGKNYWRVSAAGYDAGGAGAMCGRVKRSGNGCFAYAEGKPLPGAIDTGKRFAIR
jgi:Flp pilus assembly protein TadD